MTDGSITGRRLVAGDVGASAAGDDLFVTRTERLRYSDRGPFGTAPPAPAFDADLAKLVPALDTMSTKRGPRRAVRDALSPMRRTAR